MIVPRPPAARRNGAAGDGACHQGWGNASELEVETDDLERIVIHDLEGQDNLFAGAHSEHAVFRQVSLGLDARPPFSSALRRRRVAANATIFRPNSSPGECLHANSR